MAKGSPGKGSPGKGSPAKGSPGKGKSPKKDGSPKNKKSPDIKDIPVPIVKDVKRKLVWTEEDLPKRLFTVMQCPSCRLVIENFTQFMAHCCWRKFYQARFYLADTQAFSCLTCRQVFYSHSDHATHTCNDHNTCYLRKYREVETVLPIEMTDHIDFYINWARRTEWESTPHEPDWKFELRCSKCAGMFKQKIEYLLHSCFQFSLLKPAFIRRLKTCTHCKFVFLDSGQYDQHMPYCHKDKAQCINLNVTMFEIVCQQFVLGRHCYEFDRHLQSGACQAIRPSGEPPGAPAAAPLPKSPCPTVSAGCFDCGFVQSNLSEFFTHPCVIGRLIRPSDLELTLFCNRCQCLFTCMRDVVTHFKSCQNMVFTFVRINTLDLLRLVLRRWTIDVQANPYLPARQNRFMCAECKEVFRIFRLFIGHPCPRRERFERLLIQPSGLLETHVCHACHVVVFSASEAVSHSATCRLGEFPRMWQVHYNLDEAVQALEPWTRGPQLIELDFGLGAGEEADELTLRQAEERIVNGLPTAVWMTRFQGDNRASVRLGRWLASRADRNTEDAVAGARDLVDCGVAGGKKGFDRRHKNRVDSTASDELEGVDEVLTDMPWAVATRRSTVALRDMSLPALPSSLPAVKPSIPLSRRRSTAISFREAKKAA